MPVIIPGITFPDLATPPANTALGSLTNQYTDLFLSRNLAVGDAALLPSSTTFHSYINAHASDDNTLNTEPAFFSALEATTTTENPNQLNATQTFLYLDGSGDYSAQYLIGHDSQVQMRGTGNITQNLVGLRTFTYNAAGATIAAMYGTFNFLESDTGAIANLYGSWSGSGIYDGSVDLLANFYSTTPDPDGAGVITDLFGFYSEALGGSATNSYAFWSDERGVFRIRADNPFDSVYQAIPALYNPQFTKYTPGAADYERLILGQWNGNVAEIGTAVGVGSSVLRGLRLIGASLNVVPAATFNSTVTATDFIVSGSRFKSDTTNAHTGGLAVYDVDGAAYKDFLVWTNANAPAVVLSTPAGGTFSGDFSTLTIASAAVATQTYVNSQGFITTVGASSGTGNLVRVTSATLVTPALGTPSALILTNATGLPEGGLSLTDITTANVSATAHGFAPKFPNNTTTFLRGDGTYATPSSSGVTSIATTSPISGGTITTTGTISLLVNTDFAFTAGQTITAPAGSKALTLAGGTQTTSFPALDIAQTWNASGTTFTAAKVNATSTASASGSLLQDWQLAGVSKASIRKDGTLFVGGSDIALFSGSATDLQFYMNTGASTLTFKITPTGITLPTANFITWNTDTFIYRGGAAATIQLGADVNGAAVSQTIQAANGTIGTDKTGGNLTNRPGAGTGAGAVSSYIVQSPTLGTTGTTAQTQATRLTINANSMNATVPIAFGGNLSISNAVPTISSGFGAGATIAGIAGGFRITCGTAPGVGGTVAFNATYANAPVCFVQDETTGILGIAAPTTTTVVISGLTLLAGQTVAVFVFGY